MTVQKWIEKELTGLAKIMLLDTYLINVEYEPKKVDEGTMAQVQNNFPYLEVTIQYGDTFKKYYNDKDFKYLKRTLTHELCHVVTDKIYMRMLERVISHNEIENAREEATDHMANVVYKLLNEK
jgi:hypothetical protein